MLHYKGDQVIVTRRPELVAGGGGHGGEGGHRPPLPGHQTALGAQSVSAVSTVSSEQWTAASTLETECYVVSGLCGNW